MHGTVDGAFDSGYLMTANVNGQILRGVLFTPVSRKMLAAILSYNVKLISFNQSVTCIGT